MNVRFAVTVTLEMLAACMSGCILFEDKDRPCEFTSTCPPPPDFWIEAGAKRDAGVDDSAEAARGDAITDSGPDRAASVEMDVGDDRTGVAPVTDATASDGPAADHIDCDLSRSPAVEPCTISERYGVFVSPPAFASDAGANGTREAPYTNIQAAMAAANADHKRVYVCDDGTGYTGPLSVGPGADGVKVFGGFECSGWTYDATRRAKLTASSSPAVTVTNLVTGIVLENLEIVAGDATNPGESSIGVVVNESSGVVLRRVKVAAGRGKDGTKGENGGGPSNTIALSGVHGNPGLAACTADPRGGIPVTTTCEGLEPSTSGRGGDGAINPTSGGDNGGNGFPTYAGGKGGTGEPVSGSWSCSTGGGQPGDNGTDGPAGASGAGLGTLSVFGWKGNEGAEGSPGKPGQGGGGGGGAKAPNACTTVDGGPATPTGASGGSGGSAGCGGHPGKGGTAGGSSIALVSIGSEVTLESCELTANDAGKGGNGGQGQGGGPGGSPGSGGLGAGNPQSKPACAGGQGGNGGNGGAGGGGMGGHSIGVAYRGKAPTGLESATVKIGANGTGGQPGSGIGKGDDGVAAVSQSFDTTDAGK